MEQVLQVRRLDRITAPLLNLYLDRILLRLRRLQFSSDGPVDDAPLTTAAIFGA